MDGFDLSMGGVDWLRILLILAVGFVGWRLIGRLARLAGQRFRVGAIDTEEEKRAATLVRVVRQLLGTVLVLVVLMLVLSEFGVSITPLLGAAGVAGIAFGLGAQTLAKDFIRGFGLLFDNQVRVGDRVELAGCTGTVEAVGLRTITLRSYDGAVHFVPASEIRIVTNRSYGHVYALLEVGVAAGSDVDRALAILRDSGEALRDDPLQADALQGEVEVDGVHRWTADTVFLRARLRTRPGQDRAVLREWRRLALARLAEAGIPSQA
jgi:small conductance mechanosensitive channel